MILVVKKLTFEPLRHKDIKVKIPKFGKFFRFLPTLKGLVNACCLRGLMMSESYKMLLKLSITSCVVIIEGK